MRVTRASIIDTRRQPDHHAFSNDTLQKICRRSRGRNWGWGDRGIVGWRGGGIVVHRVGERGSWGLDKKRVRNETTKILLPVGGEVELTAVSGVIEVGIT